MERRKRRLWTRLTTLTALLILLAAGLSLAFKLAVDAVPGYRGAVETAVGEAISRPVRIGTMALTWSHLRPTLEFRDLAVLDPVTRAPLLSVAHLRMGTGIRRLLSGERMPSWVEIAGVAIDADVDAEGRWSIRGVDLSGPPRGDSPLKNLDRIERIRVDGLRFELRDLRLGPQARLQPLGLQVLQAQLQHRADRYRLDVALKPPAAIADVASLHAELAGQPAERASWQGRVEAKIGGLHGWPWLDRELPPGLRLLIDGGRASATATIEHGELRQLDGALAAQAVHAQRAGATLARAAEPRLAATLTPAADLEPGRGWDLAITELAMTGARGIWPASTGSVQLRREGPSAPWAVSARSEFLRLDDLVPWIALVDGAPPAVSRLGGDLVSTRIDLAPAAPGASAGAASDPPPRAFTVDTELRQIALKPQDNQASLTGLDGSLHVERDHARLALRGAAPVLRVPALFTQPIAIDSITATLDAQHGAGGWRLATPAFEVRLPGAEARGSLDLLLPAGGTAPPRMTLKAALASPDAAQLKGLMPLTWGEKTREWLTRALVHGRVPRGQLVVDGPLVPRDEAHPDGTPWTLELDVADGTLAFHPEWPAAEQMAAHLSFRDHGLRISADAARVDGTPVQRVDALIADFHDPVLTLEGRSVDDAGGYYRLLRDSPLRTRLANLLDRTEASGPAALALHLEIPLHGEHLETHASGTVDLGDAARGAELAVKGLPQPVRDIRGRLAFGRGVTAEGLQGRVFETAVRAAIREQPAAEAPPIDTLIADFEADPAEPAGPMAEYVPGWLRGALEGRSAFELRLPFSGPDSGRVTITSDLRGIRSQLPAPLGKSADERLPLSLRIGGGARPADAPAEEPAPLRVLIAARQDAVRVALRLQRDEAGESRTRGVEVRLGAGPVPSADADGVVVTGEPAELDGPAWATVLGGIDSGTRREGALAFRSADLRPARLRVGSSALRDVHIVANGTADGVHAVVDGETAAGTVDWHRADDGRLQARLQRLALEAVHSAPPSAKALVDAAEGKDRPAPEPFDPGHAPVLDVDVEALQIGAVALGHLRLQTARIGQGQRIERLQLAGGRVELDAQGQWQRAAGQSSAALTVAMTGTEIGPLLTALGYAETLSAARARLDTTLQWPPARQGLELALARGDLTLAFEKGQLKAVEPGGTGRMLGLINLYALPRRLLLDFRDVAGQGLAFDTLKGRFALADGQATTDDLDIDNPSLKIELRGRIGLAARDYDQRVTVRPDLSTGVTVGATLLGGPIAGGIALVVQQLAGKPLSALTQYSYRVTGSWDDPQIDKNVEHDGKDVPPPPAPAAGTPHGVTG